MKTGALRSHSAWQPSQTHPNWTQPSSTQPNPTQNQPGPTLGTKPPQRRLYSSCFPSIRYTQGKQEGIRMGPDRHLVCWEISLGWSERLPSPLPAPAHQMWGEGHIARSLCSVVWVHFLSVFVTLDGTDIFDPCHICVWKFIYTPTPAQAQDKGTITHTLEQKAWTTKQKVTSARLPRLHYYYWVRSSTGRRRPAPSAGWLGLGWAAGAGMHCFLKGWIPGMEQRPAGAHPSTRGCRAPTRKDTRHSWNMSHRKSVFILLDHLNLLLCHEILTPWPETV